jgi:hypothetical protein
VPTMKDGRHGSKGDSLGVPPGWLRGHGGRKTPFEPESSGDNDVEEDEDGEEGG